MSFHARRACSLVAALLCLTVSSVVVAQADAGRTTAGRDCVQGMVESLQVIKPEVGVDELRERAEQMCQTTGVGDVSTEQVTQQLGEILSDAVDAGDDNKMWRQILMTVLYLLVALVPAGIFAWQMKRWSDTAEDWRDPAFEMDVSIERLRDNPELLDEIRGKIEFVGLQRLPASSAGGYGGASMEVSYAAFVVDTNGETHDVSKSEDWAGVEEDAEWLAEELDVRLEDAVYG